MTEFRIEQDTMGEVRVPATARWGPQTQRAVDNFPVSGLRVDDELVHALGAIKEAAARTNKELGVIDPDVAEAVAAAADEVADGTWDAEFPIDVYQTGSGTSTNMNANEVIAGLASERLGRPVHPNDDVNASQSSNDVFPSAIHIAAARGWSATSCSARSTTSPECSTNVPRRTPRWSRPGAPTSWTPHL